MTTGAREAGFTLLEVLVALVVLGFLLVGLSGGVQLGVRGWDTQARAAATFAELDAVDAALRRLVAAVDPGDPTRPAGLAGTTAELRMVTALPAAVSNQQADVALLVQDGVLLLRWRPHVAGLVPATAPAVPAQMAELMRGLSGLRIAYWGPNGWQDGWTAADPPALVRLALLFPPNDPAGRHWPPIVAAPARTREGR